MRNRVLWTAPMKTRWTVFCGQQGDFEWFENAGIIQRQVLLDKACRDENRNVASEDVDYRTKKDQVSDVFDGENGMHQSWQQACEGSSQ